MSKEDSPSIERWGSSAVAKNKIKLEQNKINQDLTLFIAAYRGSFAVFSLISDLLGLRHPVFVASGRGKFLFFPICLTKTKL